MTEKYYLGLDLSTQQLKCTVIDDKHEIVLEEAVNLDKDLPEFNTVHGAIMNDNVVTSPTLMWVKALDLLLNRLKDSSYIGSIVGISGAGQVCRETKLYYCSGSDPLFLFILLHIATR